MTAPNVIKIEVTGHVKRRGISAKTQKPWCTYQAYVHLPGHPYPQEGGFYAEGDSNVPQAGTYEVDYTIEMKDGRPVLSDIDPRQGRRVNTVSAVNSQKTA
ncbi:hypothetical protein BVY11_20995 [Pseudomonas amygdali pv. morsprunorum]|nr:hypothetical protein BVY11_20995 [Pseudomonas amygdali pv. morsprunorum]PPS33195.1 hypothetical protein BVY12_16725 [Pseudomonas amygdali pv. morsprunorum]